MEHTSANNVDCHVRELNPLLYGPCCEGLEFYRAHEGMRYCVLHLPSEEKQDDFQEALDQKLSKKDFNFAGAFFPRGTAQFKGSSAFVEATFSDGTFEGAEFDGATFRGKTNFYGATFKQNVIFSDATFEGPADFRADFERLGFFSKATFKGDVDFSGVAFKQNVDPFFHTVDFSNVTFKQDAHFIGATFGEEANFVRATFEGKANFVRATFERRANFIGAACKEAVFEGATFDDWADFRAATFKGKVDFSETHFKESARFWRLTTSPHQTLLNFRNALIEKPERFSFQSTSLRPSWFIDIDAQKFDFSDVEWFRLSSGDELELEDEINALKDLRIDPPQSLRKLSKACRKLMNNAEENRDYPTANEFHYWSMEALRKEGWSRLGLIATLYWILSGYGERPRRAFGVVVAIWLIFTALYLTVGASHFPALMFSDSRTLPYLDIAQVGQAAAYSLSAIARLTPAEPKLSPGWFQFLVTVEGLLGPVQIALFLLAVRRKVMR